MRASEFDDPEAAMAFLAALKHPLKPVIENVRAAILEADKTITEGIKWNTASFYRHGWFATINVRAKAGVQIILHRGAKIRDDGEFNQAIEDPSHLLAWLGKDRASVTFADAADFQNERAAFVRIITHWVAL